MKIQFTTGTIGLAAVAAAGIDRLTAEDNLATVDLGDLGTLDSSSVIGEIATKLRQLSLDSENTRDAQVFSHLAEALGAAWSSATAKNREAQNEIVASEEAAVDNTGSHSLPTGSETTSNSSQANSDEHEELKNNVEQTEEQSPRRRNRKR